MRIVDRPGPLTRVPRPSTGHTLGREGQAAPKARLPGGRAADALSMPVATISLDSSSLSDPSSQAWQALSKVPVSNFLGVALGIEPRTLLLNGEGKKTLPFHLGMADATVTGKGLLKTQSCPEST